MGKSSRNRNERNQKGAVFPDFPYDRKFTQAEIEVILERKDRLVEAFRDAVGPQGWGLGIGEEFLHQLMLHGALAGVDVDPTYPGDKAFIRPRRKPDADGQFVDAVEWVVIKGDSPKQRRIDAREEAKARVAALDDLPDDVRGEIRDLFIRGGDYVEEHPHHSADAPDPHATADREEPTP